MEYLATLTLLFSASSRACPDLTGTYTCEVSSTKKETKVIQQSKKNGVMVYWVNDLEMVTDDKPRFVPENENLRQGTFRVWCDGDIKVKTQLLGKYHNNSGYFGDLTANSEWFMRDDAHLVRYTSGDIRSPDGTVMPFDDEVLCKRN